jgi:hypothetical protein
MPTEVHQLDDGAWISVNNSREVNVSDLWRLHEHDICGCETADFLVEGFVEVGVDGRAIEARIAGQCIACGRSGVTDWLTVGVSDPTTNTFYDIDRDGIHLPGQRADTRHL